MTGKYYAPVIITLVFEFQVYSHLLECKSQHISYCGCNAGGNYVIIRIILLKYQVHRADIILRMAPVAAGRKISEIDLVLNPRCNPRDSPGDFTGNEWFPPYK